jgi:O-methyltransferase
MTSLRSGAEKASSDAQEIRDLYLDLLRGALTHTVYAESDAGVYSPRSPLGRWLLRLLAKRRMAVMRLALSHESYRAEGRDWPVFAQTMVGLARLDQLRTAVETVIAEEVPGDLIEAGVWRGGASIFMKGVLKAYGVEDRTIWAADSFRGLPPADAERYPADAVGTEWHRFGNLAVDVEAVKHNFRRYGLLDDRVRFLEGWFSETLPTVRDRTWSIVRLDGDMYESTMDGLKNLYPGLALGGFLIIDDYAIPECKEAVEDFRRSEGITEPLEQIDWTGVYWRRNQ